ncbi:MAG: esterase FrsA, partial [Acidobacteriota bacterium]|nr:esterase FrsA [Acidobacteriota bacterium]
MKRLICYMTAALGLLIVSSISIFAQTAAIEGNWFGTLETSGIKLRLVLKVTKAADGSLAAKIDSIDQGANNIEVDSFSRQNKSVRFEAKKYGMIYEGALNEKGDEISGIFKQGPASLPLIFKRSTVAIKSGRPQDPQKPFPYDEEEVTYENKKDTVKLAGTLTLPRTGGQKHPAVILITGSGAQDRNETILGHRPFLVLADYLTRRGIAVLRVDDRGIGGSTMGSQAATSENFTGDVLAGIE